MMINTSSLSRFLVMTAVTGCLGVMALTRVSADPTDERSVGAALSGARSWVSEIDAGRYDASYTEGSSDFQRKVTQDRWTMVMKALRPSWGGVISRKEVSHVYHPNGLPAENLEGPCMVITYQTDFKNFEGATEQVALQWTGGKWLPAGYVAGPKPDKDPTAASRPSNTEVTTETVKNPPR